MTDRIIHWFRRDLRLDDNTALLAAYDGAAEVVPVFIFDRTILERPDTGGVRVKFLLDTLAALDADLRARGGRLVLREGTPEEELARLIAETGAKAVFYNRDVEPFARARDARVAERLGGTCEVRGFDDGELHPPETIKTKGGTVYTVFTPYKKTALAIPVPKPRSAPEVFRVPEGIVSNPLPTLAELGHATEVKTPPGGEGPARERLEGFVRRHLHEYDRERDAPAKPGTSGLAPYLRFGCLSPRRAFHAAEDAVAGRTDRAGADVWISELLWRDFYRQILFHFPYVETGSFKKSYDELAWERNDELFEAWKAGRTGFPIVDAGMRQLNQIGWMHNRVRMIVASFLTKDLLIDWRRGERYFMEKLVDGDLAANNGGWQWAASTGTDAQPYFRIFNPVSQGQKFDPTGAYVRKYVPELASVPEKWIHEPWNLPLEYRKPFRCQLGTDYPYPVVDHARQREKALALFKKIG